MVSSEQGVKPILGATSRDVGSKLLLSLIAPRTVDWGFEGDFERLMNDLRIAKR